MTEHEEAVGRQRLDELAKRKRRLIELETNMKFLFSKDVERLARAQDDHDTLAAIVAAIEVDPPVVAVRLMDAEQRMAGASNSLAEAQKQLATHQAAVDKAQAEVTEAQTALDALKTP